MSGALELSRASASERYDVVAVGDCGIDLYARVPRLPGRDEKVPGEFEGVFGGGVAANFACAAARLGARTALLSVVGADAFGDRAVETVAAFGVDTSGIRIRDDAPTYFCFVCLDPSGEKALTIVRTAAFAPRPQDVSMDHLHRARLVHIAPFDLDTAVSVAREATGLGIPVSVDLEPGSASTGLDRLRPLLERTTILLPNEHCLQALLPGPSAEDAARHLRDLGPQTVVATLGERGALVVTADATTRVPAHRVEVKDTTGAGDCFNAALVTRWLSGDDVVAATRFAVAAAAMSIQRIGAREGLPTPEDVAGFMGSVSEEAPA